MKPPEALETERLILRRFVMEDAEAVFERYAQDAEVTRFMTWRPHKSLDETREYRRQADARWESGRDFRWAVTTPEDGLIGAIALRVNGFKANLGYVIARPWWNRGFATEATRAVVDWTMAQPAIHRVWAVCDVDNGASARVLEKAGMQFEGILHRWIIHPQLGDTPRDCRCYAVVK
jgi:[ribosomal protein S5]-alanine N-acetyltransferase